MLNFTPLNQPESLSQMAYTAIRPAILSGEIKINETHKEVLIAKNLRISRTPLRKGLGSPHAFFSQGENAINAMMLKFFVKH